MTALNVPSVMTLGWTVSCGSFVEIFFFKDKTIVASIGERSVPMPKPGVYSTGHGLTVPHGFLLYHKLWRLT